MDRLTKNNREDNKGDYYYPECLERCDGLGASEKCNECDFCYAVCEKLGKYEDLDEQGRLIKLPCKVGDTVYSIANDGKIYPVKATREVRIVNGVLHIICESCRYSDLVSYDDIGKTVFLTKSEAEAKLKELRGEQND